MKKGGVSPCLAIVRAGAREDDLSYERGIPIRILLFYLFQNSAKDNIFKLTSPPDHLFGLPAKLFRPLPVLHKRSNRRKRNRSWRLRSMRRALCLCRLWRQSLRASPHCGGGSPSSRHRLCRGESVKKLYRLLFQHPHNLPPRRSRRCGLYAESRQRD